MARFLRKCSTPLLGGSNNCPADCQKLPTIANNSQQLPTIANCWQFLATQFYRKYPPKDTPTRYPLHFPKNPATPQFFRLRRQPVTSFAFAVWCVVTRIIVGTFVVLDITFPSQLPGQIDVSECARFDSFKFKKIGSGDTILNWSSQYIGLLT